MHDSVSGFRPAPTALFEMGYSSPIRLAAGAVIVRKAIYIGAFAAARKIALTLRL
jgi:hypothetical protein